MPDKKKYVEEMTRVLKPSDRIVIATWCQRDEGSKQKRDKCWIFYILNGHIHTLLQSGMLLLAMLIILLFFHPRRMN